jgi:hypothetical protein
LQRSALAGAVRGLLAGPGKLDAVSGGGLGNSHRSKLAIPLEKASGVFRALRLYLIIVIHYIKFRRLSTADIAGQQVCDRFDA